MLVARLGTVVSEPPAAGAHRWWVTLDDAAAALVTELEDGLS